MRAVAISGFGATPELVELPKPIPGPAELLVRIHAAAYNPFDLKIVDGALKDSVQHKFPLILGLDGAGVVEAVGPGVQRHRPGDKVYGQFLNPAKGRGSYAEYAIATAASPLAKMPQGMIFTQAAAVPTASMTAFNMVEAARIDAGHRVLIVGATGAVGQSAVQFAADRGAHVIATAKPDAATRMKDLGAAETIDHTKAPLTDQLAVETANEGLDVIIDLVSAPPAFANLTKLVKPGGVMLSSVYAADPEALAAQEIRGLNFNNSASAQLLATLADLIDSSKLRVRVDQELPLAQAPEALARLRSGATRGKIVFEL